MLAIMASRDSASSEITPEVLLRAYACGIFPMAESADDPSLFWVEPEMRGVIPLDGFRVASRLARSVRSDAFRVTVNTAFKATIAGCAAPQTGREDTWINKRIRELYGGLYELGHCHSVEVWQDDDLILSITDDGVGDNAKADPRSTGLGQRIVAAMASKLDATVERDPNHVGTRIVLRFRRQAAPASKTDSDAAS